MISSLEFVDETTNPPCQQCGTVTNTICGKLFDYEDELLTTYYVSWTVEGSKTTAAFDFVFREWNEEQDCEEGVVISLEYKNDPEAKGFTIIDGRPSFLNLDGVTRLYSKEEVLIWEPMKRLIYQACEFIVGNDHRLEEILSSLS